MSERAARALALPRHELVGPASAPLVVVLGGVSAGPHVTATSEDPTPGWWERVVGPARAIDTRRFRVLCMDWLLEPPDDVQPAPTTHDQAEALARTLDAVGVERAYAVIGASYGGMVALAFGERYGERAEGLIAISAAHESRPMSTGLRSLQRRIARLGIECGQAREALVLARALGTTTYRSAGEMHERFSPVVPEGEGRDVTFAVERYLMHKGERFAERFDTARFLALSLSADLHRVEPSAIRVPTLLVAADGDTLVPRDQITELSRRLGGPCRLARLATRVGHDAFLAEPRKIGRILAAALEHGGIA